MDEEATATAEPEEDLEPSNAERDLVMLVRRYSRELTELLSSGKGTISDVDSLLRGITLESDDVYRALTSSIISEFDDSELVDAKKASTPGGA